MSQRRAPDLRSLSEGDLHALREAVNSELARRFRARQIGERARGGLLESHGPRYRNPGNPSETWSGRGEPPLWIRELRGQGIRLEDLRVDDDRPAPTPKRRTRR